MSKLHAQLALFGAIDEEVTNAKIRLKEGSTGAAAARDCEVIELASKFLPGTAGFGQNRWYPELTEYLRRPELRTDPVSSGGPSFPELGDAIQEISDTSNEPNDHDPAMARASYAAIVLRKIFDLTSNLPAPHPDVLSLLNTTLISWTEEGFGEPIANELIGRIAEIEDRPKWLLVAGDVVGSAFANAGLPCFGGLKKVHGRYHAFITTDDLEEKLSVADLAKVIEPINWDDLCTFFCKMTEQTTNKFTTPGGASRLLESISGECNEYRLNTALVFWKAKQADGSIYLNYDLDQHRDQDNLLVEVDSGYILVTPIVPGQSPGVRFRTSKLERVDGLSPTATAALACLMGWGTFAKEMFAGKASEYAGQANPPPPIQPFRRSPNDSKSFTDSI